MSTSTQSFSQEWWRLTTVYQIYPRSFYDSNGDGIGDLEGIIEKLDYIQSLGFETIWFSPFFKSPQQDFGYDVSDYFSIAPEYGDLETCERLIEAIHQRGMKVVFDLVMNHTSIEHAWFNESRSSRDNPKADWYVWQDGKGRNGKKPPTNWKAMIGGSGWHYDETRKQFYWASFLPFQPDLNYRNPEVKKVMLDMVRFWLKKGVDGFRLDIFNAIFEDAELRDNPFSFKIFPSENNPDGFFQKAKYNINLEESFEFAVELRNVVDEFSEPPRFLIGEVFGDLKTLKKFCDYKGEKGLHTVFLFKTLTTPLKSADYRKMISEFETLFPTPYVPTYVYSNHDRTRSFTRWGKNIKKSKLMALFQFTVRGIPFTYYGEELGMPNVHIPLKKGKDPLAKRYERVPQWLLNFTKETINRDECRTPMLWDESEHAGFTEKNSKPWLPIPKNYEELPVKKQEKDAQSLLNFYRQVIDLKNKTTALKDGSLQIAEVFCNEKIFAFYRTTENEKILVLLNLSGKGTDIPEIKGKMLFSTHPENQSSRLNAYEGRVILL